MNLSLLGNLRKALLALTVACFVAGVAIAPACDRAALENYRHDPTDRFAEMQWPDRGLGAMLPAPESSYGVIYNDKAQWFNGDVGNYTREQYGAYVASCEDAGFTVEYTKNNDAFWAWNEEGYYLHLGYDEDKSYMSFSLEAPKEEESGGSGVSNGGSEEDVGADDGAATDAPDQKTNQDEEPTGGASASGEVTPSFKEYMDSYEAFFDEYIAFMDKYEESTDYTPEMLDDFNTYMERYTDMTAKMNEVDTGALSPADLAYYNEVNARVYEKLYDLENGA
ncbi:DUF6591 domain-containing protein [Adlercreutzia equolifaciens]|uniref:DUF6591 domain-containing protein n=1 Tax=Adlercreutzia TaxID=447020 RepID=UPI00399D41BC